MASAAAAAGGGRGSERVNTRVRKKHGLPPHGRTTVGNKRGITDTQPNKATDRQWEEEEEEEAAEGENF